MLHKRWATLAGILAVVAILLMSARLALAQEGQPPSVQPSDVDSQANDVLWDQMGPVADTGQGVISYNNVSGQALAGDDFVITDTAAPSDYTAWIMSQVVVRGIVDQFFSGGAEKATLCFYSDSGSQAPLASAFSCYANLTPSGSSTEHSDLNFTYYVLTYTISPSPLFWTNTRYWLGVSMAAPNGFWSWRARSALTPYSNTVATTQPFAFRISPNMFPGNYSAGCTGTWQVQQTNPNNCAIPPSASWWPSGKDLSFKLVGSKFFGHLAPMVFLPSMRH